MKIGRLFIGRHWCNPRKSEAVIASWTAPSGYWRWSIYWKPPRRLFCWPSINPSFGSGTIYSPGRGHFGAWSELPLVGVLSISIQPPYPK